MPVGFNRIRKRLQRVPLKKNEFRCTMVTQNVRSQQNQTVSFQEEQNEWNKKWDSKKTITYALIKDSKDITKNGLEKSALYYSMMTWALEIPLTFKMVKKNQNPKLTVEFKNSSNDKYFKEKSHVLAYAYFPGQSKQGIIKVNDDHKWSLTGKKTRGSDPYNIVSTLMHEIGHALGLTHSKGSHSIGSVMHPTYNGKLKLSAYDKLRIVKKYGNRKWTNYQDYKNFGESIYTIISNTNNFQ